MYSSLYQIKETILFDFLSGISIAFYHMLFLCYIFPTSAPFFCVCHEHNIIRLSSPSGFLGRVMSQGGKYSFNINESRKDTFTVVAFSEQH